MGLFSQPASQEPAAPSGTRATAMIVESEQRPGQRGPDTGTDWVEIAWEATAGIPYRFVLDVTAPAGNVYRVEIATRVQSRYERTGVLNGRSKIPAGVEVPVTINPADPNDVEIDWTGFGSSDAQKRAREEASIVEADYNYARQFATWSPKVREPLLAASRMQIELYAQMAKAGQITPEQFEQNVIQDVRKGLITPEQLAEVAKAFEQA